MGSGGLAAAGKRAGEGTIVGTMPLAGNRVEVPRYSVFPPLEGFDGDLDDTVLYAGQSCALVNDVKPAAQIIRELVSEAEAALSKAALTFVVVSPPVRR